MTNLEISRKTMKAMHPEDARIDSADARYIVNRYLLSPDRQNAFAKAAGYPSMCEACSRSSGCAYDAGSVSMRDYVQRNMCYCGIIEWMESTDEDKERR